MNKETVILYLPNTTTQEEIKEIRKNFKDKNVTLILMISGNANLLDNLQSMLTNNIK